jgi:uncharacterized damage-inducible protein DinB
MRFTLNKSIEVLAATPIVLQAFLAHLSEEWLHGNEGENTWNPHQVVQHLITAEKTNWIPRMEIILSAEPVRAFKVFNRTEEAAKSQTIGEALNEFAQLRAQNIVTLKSKNLSANDFEKTAIHPEFGEVKLSQLLATWTAHDLSHIGQISRVMAKQYKDAIGPWTAYLPIMTK